MQTCRYILLILTAVLLIFEARLLWLVSKDLKELKREHKKR